MSSYQNTTSPERGYDGRWSGNHGELLVEIKRSSNIRDVRASLLALTYALAEDPRAAGALCVVVDSKLSTVRLASELAQFRSLIKPELADKIDVSTMERLQQGSRDLTQQPHSAFISWLEDLAERETGATRVSKQTVMAALAVNWLRGREFDSTKKIQEAFKASYPTVVAALKEFTDRDLTNAGAREFRLIHMPTDFWMQLADKQIYQRKTLRYGDPSGLARSPESMLKRLSKLWLDREALQVTAGGVLGAKHYFPELDITGSPRLDLSVYGQLPKDLVKMLDAGLEPVGAKDKAHLSVHITTEPPSLTHSVHNTQNWASEMECTADLIEMNLTREAREMASHLLNKRMAAA